MKYLRFSFLLALVLLLPQWAGATAYVRYVDADSVGGDGTTTNTTGSTAAFKTLDQVDTAIAAFSPTGNTMTIYFQRGDTWTIADSNDYLYINNTNITLDAYGAGALPIIDGNDYRWNASLPPSSHAPLIRILQPGCTIRNLHVQDAWASGVSFNGDGVSAITSGTIEYCTVSGAGWAGIHLYGTATHPVSTITVQYNTVTDCVRKGSKGPDAYSTTGGPQAIAGNASNYATDCLYRYNYVYDCYGEGIGCNNGVAEYNIIGETSSAGIYAGERPAVIRYNICYGLPSANSADATYLHTVTRNGRTWCNSGISINREDASLSSTDPTEIYGNVVVGRLGGLRVMNQGLVASQKAIAYNNTFIDNAENYYISAASYWTLIIKNNVSVVNTDANTYCDHVDATGTTGWTIGPNLWSSTPENATWTSVADEVSSPTLPKSSGWLAITGLGDFAFSDIYPPIGSTAVDNAKAVNLQTVGKDYHLLLTTGTAFSTTPSSCTWVRDENADPQDFGAIVRLQEEANTAPNGTITAPSTGTQACGVAMACTSTYTDTESDTVTWDWNWGDGSTHSTTQNPAHTYTENGNFVVTLTVTDEHGLPDGSPATVLRTVSDCGAPDEDYTAWGRRLPIVIQASKVGETTSSDPAIVPVLLIQTNFPQTDNGIFDADGTNPALNGGADIRFSLDQAGAQKLARHIVSFVTNNTPANGTAQVWVGIPRTSLSAVSDTTIYCWYNNGAETEPAAGSTYGSEAVYSSNFKAAWHLEEATNNSRLDATQYDETLAESVGDDVATGTGKIGTCVDLAKADTEYLTIADGSDVDISGASQTITLSCWLNAETLDANSRYAISKYDSTSERQYALNEFSDSGYFLQGILGYNSGDSYEGVNDGSSISTSTWYRVTVVYDGSYIRLYKNGTLASGGDNPLAYSSSISAGSAPFALGVRFAGGDPYATSYWDGLIDEVWILNSAVSPGWELTAYNNQSNPATFAIEGAAEDPTPVATPVIIMFQCSGADCSDGMYTTTDTVGGYTVTMNVSCDFDLDGVKTITATFNNGKTTTCSQDDLTDSSTFTLDPITVAEGDDIDDLDIVSIALTNGAGIVAHSDGVTAADLGDIPTGSMTGSLASNHDIAIATIGDTVEEVIGFDIIKCPLCSVNDTFTSGTGIIGLVCSGRNMASGNPEFSTVGLTFAYPATTQYASYYGKHDFTYGGIEKTTFMWAIDFEEGFRTTDLQISGTDGFSATDGTFQNLASLDLTRDLPALASGHSLAENAAIAVSVPFTTTNPMNTYATFTTALAGLTFFVPDDVFTFATMTDANVDCSGSDGTDGHPITFNGNSLTMTTFTVGDWSVLNLDQLVGALVTGTDPVINGGRYGGITTGARATITGVQVGL